MPLHLKRRHRVTATIPTASMGDIAFLLLIFFMVTAIFRKESGLTLELPRAESGEREPRQLVSSIYIDERGTISIDDRIVPVAAVSDLIGSKLEENPQLVVAFKTDLHTPYRVVAEVIEELKDVNALRVFFDNDLETRPGPKW